MGSPLPGVNEPHYLTKARSFVDPTWCSRDFFLTSSNAHYCFYWLTGSVTQLVSLDTVALLGRLTSSLLLALGWNMLGRSLDLTVRFRLIAAGLFASLSLAGNFSGEWLLGGFESKVPAWGFCLMAVSLWIRGQQRTCPGWMTVAGVLCGLGCSLHPVVGGWVAACVCMASAVMLMRTRSQRLKAMAGLTGFAGATIVFSLPGLIPALRLVMDTSLPQKERELASFYQVFWRLKHHLDPTELVRSQWLYALIVGSSVVLTGIALRRTQRATSTLVSSGSPDEERSAGRRRTALECLLTFFAMSALIAFAGVLLGWHTEPAQKMDSWEWRASLLKFYPFRCFDALLPVTLALLITQMLQYGGRSQPESAQGRPSAGLSRLLGSLRYRSSAFSGTLLMFAVAVPLLQSWWTRESAPAGYTAAQFADWRDACDWIGKNTPNDSLFLTPRESFAFKWFAERAEFVCYKDCPQDAAGILTWNKRLWMLHDWTLKSSADLLYDEGDLRTLRKQTGCDFIITRILGPFENKPVWEGREWKIYAVP